MVKTPTLHHSFPMGQTTVKVGSYPLITEKKKEKKSWKVHSSHNTEIITLNKAKKPQSCPITLQMSQ